MKTKQSNPNRLGFKSYFGTTAMGITDGLVNGLMTSWFMVYLTDYAGLGAFGAVLGSTVLLLARIFDAVNDPLEGWIMDRAKVGKHGKYRPFIMLSILMSAIGAGCLFFIPAGGNKVLTCVWVIVFYLIYDIGASFFAPNLIYRSLTLDPNQRGKLMIAPRLVGMMMGMFTAALIAIVNGVNASIGNMHDAFGITVMAMLAVTVVISLTGIGMVKEKYHSVADESEGAEKVKFTDFFLLLRDNKALRVRLLDRLFSGFIWTFLFSTMLYYIKWGICTDLSTGAVDDAAYASYSMIASMLMFVPLLLGTVVAAPIMKKLGSPMRFNRILLLTQAVSCGVLFIFHMTGLLQRVPMLFFICTGITATAIGAGFMPGTTIDIECMDYQIYKNGSDRSALCNAFVKFLDKGQSAIANGGIGIMLVAIGYVVDSTTGDFAGDIANMPTMLHWFMVMMALIPCIFGLIAWVITKAYPITDEIRADMKEKLSK